MNIYIGGEYINTPLGLSAEDNFSAALADGTGIRPIDNIGFNKETIHLSSFQGVNKKWTFSELLEDLINQLRVDKSILISSRTKIILSTTKGDINNGVEGALLRAFNSVATIDGLANSPMLISTACISGVLAISKASEYIKLGLYDHVIVIACDVLSDFVIYGFQSLYAIGNDICKPYDRNRTGINLGEGGGSVVLSNTASIFNQAPLRYVSGSSSNDANHISGPSRTGEGLYRTVIKTMQLAKIEPTDIGYISAHGTATQYNDDMESIAFSRLNLSGVPLNSLKAYFGHTLGAAGVIETAVAMQSLRNQQLVECKGYAEPGTTESMNIITESVKSSFDYFLKTASGFGGGNASILIRKL